MKFRKKAGWIFLAVLLAGLSWSNIVDDVSMEQTDAALKRALLTFAVARALNGVISVAQGTEVAIHPAGFGVNITPGEMLDPLNDLIEQFSWVMLASAVSLGIQKTFLIISSSNLASVLLTILLLTYFVLTLGKMASNSHLAFGIRISLLLMLFFRFSVPVVVFIGNSIYQGFLADDYEQSRQALDLTEQNLVKLNQTERQVLKDQANVSMVDKAKRMIHSAVDAMDVEARLERYKQAASDATQHTVDLMVVFILQTVLLPLLFLWLCYRLFSWLLTRSVLSWVGASGTGPQDSSQS